MSSSTYFSIDYRSPPSGLGQIVNPQAPQMVDGKYNMTLVQAISEEDKDWAQPNQHYLDNKIFMLEDDWFNLDELSQLHDYLVEQGVETVYDSEMSYDFPEHFDENQHIPLSDWFNLVKDQL